MNQKNQEYEYAQLMERYSDIIDRTFQANAKLTLNDIIEAFEENDVSNALEEARSYYRTLVH